MSLISTLLILRRRVCLCAPSQTCACFKCTCSPSRKRLPFLLEFPVSPTWPWSWRELPMPWSASNGRVDALTSMLLRLWSLSPPYWLLRGSKPQQGLNTRCRGVADCRARWEIYHFKKWTHELGVWNCPGLRTDKSPAALRCALSESMWPRASGCISLPPVVLCDLHFFLSPFFF